MEYTFNVLQVEDTQFIDVTVEFTITSEDQGIGQYQYGSQTANDSHIIPVIEDLEFLSGHFYSDDEQEVSVTKFPDQAKLAEVVTQQLIKRVLAKQTRWENSKFGR